MSWPPELTDARPYSSGPLSRWDPIIMGAFPPRGGSMWVDSSNHRLHREMVANGFDPGAVDLPIRMCLFAPPPIQRAYTMAGGKGIVMMSVPGLAEALGQDPDQQTSMRITDPVMDLVDQMTAEIAAQQPRGATTFRRNR